MPVATLLGARRFAVRVTEMKYALLIVLGHLGAYIFLSFSRPDGRQPPSVDVSTRECNGRDFHVALACWYKLRPVQVRMQPGKAVGVVIDIEADYEMTQGVFRNERNHVDQDEKHIVGPVSPRVIWSLVRLIRVDCYLPAELECMQAGAGGQAATEGVGNVGSACRNSGNPGEYMRVAIGTSGHTWRTSAIIEALPEYRVKIQFQDLEIWAGAFQQAADRLAVSYVGRTYPKGRQITAGGRGTQGRDKIFARLRVVRRAEDSEVFDPMFDSFHRGIRE